MHDVEELNRAAFEERFDITKLSFHAYLLVREKYRLLSVGSALGFGCGPVLIAKRDLTREDLTSCRIAIPGEFTTAHLLLRLYAPEAQNKTFVVYDKVFKAIQSGQADCGVIIHESRFTFEQLGLRKIVDLGDWWEKETGHPIPLGGIAMRKDLTGELAKPFEDILRKSIKASYANPEQALPYIRQHAQEMEPEILRKHIKTFVNDFTLDLGDTGHAAIAKLEEMAHNTGVIT